LHWVIPHEYPIQNTRVHNKHAGWSLFLYSSIFLSMNKKGEDPCLSPCCLSSREAAAFWTAHSGGRAGGLPVNYALPIFVILTKLVLFLFIFVLGSRRLADCSRELLKQVYIECTKNILCGSLGPWIWLCCACVIFWTLPNKNHPIKERVWPFSNGGPQPFHQG